MFGFPTQRQYIAAPVTLIVLMFLVEFLIPNSSSYLVLTPDSVFNGEIWRIFTAHLLHTNLNHLLLNAAGIVLIWALHGEYYTTKRYVYIMSTSFVLIGIFVLFFTDYSNYMGMSAVIHGMIVYGAIKDITKKDLTGWLILIGVLAKVIYENIFGASSSTATIINANVAVEAHLIGCLVGMLIAFVTIKR